MMYPCQCVQCCGKAALRSTPLPGINMLQVARADVCRWFPLRAVNLEDDKKCGVQEEEEVEEDVQVKKRARKGSHA